MSLCRDEIARLQRVPMKAADVLVEAGPKVTTTAEQSEGCAKMGQRVVLNADFLQPDFNRTIGKDIKRFKRGRK